MTIETDKENRRDLDFKGECGTGKGHQQSPASDSRQGGGGGANQAGSDTEVGVEQLQRSLVAANDALARAKSRIFELEHELEQKLEYIEDKELYIAVLTADLSEARTKVAALLNSASWRITGPLRALAAGKIGRSLVRNRGPIAEEATPEPVSDPYSDFNPYDHVTALKPISVVTTADEYSEIEITTPFTAICTVLNESEGIDKFLESLSCQTLMPNEIIFVDGGSQDDTVVRIERWAEKVDTAVRVVVEQGASIARGRNYAIGESRNDVVVVVDAGCVLGPAYCRALVGSLEEHPDADMVGGIYLPTSRTRWSKYFICNWATCDWETFLPSSRSLLIRKSVWERCGGYPEHLTRTGEDTLFDINYRRYSQKWVFSRKAIVRWESPANERDALSLAKSYGVGDGESGFGDYRFYRELKTYLRGIRHEPGSKVEATVYAGYLEGRARRATRILLERDLRGVAVILSGVPISDSGGGQRCTQLAVEFAHQGYKVVFVNIYPSFESGSRVFLDVDPSRIDLYALADFNVNSVLEDYDDVMASSLVLVEFPHPDLLPILNKIRKRASRPRIIYDYIDNWQTSLGWTWYTPQTESKVVALSDDLVASARTLQEQLARREKRGVSLVPNAFNARLFNCEGSIDRPEDLEDSGRRTVMYVGALWGDWFDWELLFDCARALPDYDFILIGNATPEIVSKASGEKNIRCLGLKPQRALPAYLRFADVSIIPFKCDSVTHFVNPLKVYEYLAMQVPVVTTAMPELSGMPGVTSCSTTTEFIDALRLSDRSRLNVHSVDRFLSSNNWSARVEKLTAIIEDRDLPITSLDELSGASLAGSAMAAWHGVLSIADGEVVSVFPLAHKNSSVHEPELNLARYYAREDDSFLDVGANVGQTIASVRTVNPEIPVISFEPNPLLAEALGKAAAKLGPVEVHAIALASEPSETVLWVPVVDGYLVTPLASFDLNVIYEANQFAYIRSLSASGDLRLLPLEVRMKRGDDFGLDPTIAKIDVEGFELDAIKGLRETINRARPLLIVERSYKSAEVAQWLSSLGYRTYRYDGDKSLEDISRVFTSMPAEDWPMNMVFIHEEMLDDVRSRGLVVRG